MIQQITLFGTRSFDFPASVWFTELTGEETARIIERLDRGVHEGLISSFKIEDVAFVDIIGAPIAEFGVLMKEVEELLDLLARARSMIGPGMRLPAIPNWARCGNTSFWKSVAPGIVEDRKYVDPVELLQIAVNANAREGWAFVAERRMQVPYEDQQKAIAEEVVEKHGGGKKLARKINQIFGTWAITMIHEMEAGGKKQALRAFNELPPDSKNIILTFIAEGTWADWTLKLSQDPEELENMLSGSEVLLILEGSEASTKVDELVESYEVENPVLTADLKAGILEVLDRYGVVEC